MGNKQSQSSITHKQHDINPPHLMLSNCKMIITEDNKLLKSSWSFIDRKIYQNWRNGYTKFLVTLFHCEKYKEVAKNPISNFVFIPQYHEYVEMGYCSTNGVVNMLYEIVEDSLVKDIELRSIENNPFPENEIWIVLYLLTKTASSFHDKGLSIGDIRPENIFLAENEKFVKIATEHSWIGEKTLRDKFLAKEKIFLSKAMIECFSTQSIVPLKISFSNDSFAIGMTLAECILLQDLSKIYEFKNNSLSINKDKHDSIIQNLLRVKYYPLKLLIFVVGLIQIEQQHRFSIMEIVRCLDEFQVEILTENQLVIGKAHFKKNFGPKFDHLYSILSQYKSNIHSRLFINRELSLSNAYTINGLSTVQMAKRTYDDTFNIELFDLSSSPILYKLSQVDEDKSWNSPDQKPNHFIQKSKKSNILDQFYYQNSEKKSIKTAEKKRRIQNLKLSPELVESEVKRVTNTPEREKEPRGASPIPVTNHNSLEEQQKSFYLHSPQLKIFQAKRGEENFSFHSPQSLAKQYPSPAISSLNKNNKFYESNEYLNIPSNIAESIILANHSSEHPQSYMTYQYSKSKSNQPHKDRTDSQNELFLNPAQVLLKNLKKTSDMTECERESYATHFVPKRKSLDHNIERNHHFFKA